jgi:hypothetical protein
VAVGFQRLINDPGGAVRVGADVVAMMLVIISAVFDRRTKSSLRPIDHDRRGRGRQWSRFEWNRVEDESACYLQKNGVVRI